MTRTIDWRFLDGSSFSDITEYFRLYEVEVTSAAEEGSVATSTVRADDPDGVLDIIGHSHFRMFEDAATGSNTCIGQWHTAARKVHRGDYHRVGLGRVWDIELVDLNALLSRRVLHGSDTNRPAETDVARIQWLLSTSSMFLITDTEYFDTTGAVAMDGDVDYDGQTPQNVLDDCAQQSGKNYFVWYNEGQDAYSLWYGFADSTDYSSPLRLSNFLTDIDETWTFAISPDTELSRDPSRVASGVYLPYQGGAVYRFSTDTAYIYPRRDAVMPSLNVKSATKADARAVRYLGELDTEDDVITTTVILPAAKVNFLMQGMRVQFRASHLPDYVEYRWMRVLTRTVRELSETDERTYAVTLELSAGTSAAAEEGPGEGSDAFGIFYSPTNEHTGDFNRSDDVVWSNSGDNPGTGQEALPTVGSLTKLSTVYAAGTKFDGWRIDGDGTLDVDVSVNGIEVYAQGDRTATVVLEKNGVEVAHGTETITLPNGTFWGWGIAFSVNGLSVSNGDVLAVRYTGDLSLSGRYPKIPSGTGSGLVFRVEGILT